jgi:hypothetical protein
VRLRKAAVTSSKQREEVKGMKAWRRFEDWANVVLGAYLLAVLAPIGGLLGYEASWQKRA